MANLTRANYDAIRDHLFDRVHKNGEQLKNDFPNILRRAIEAEAWTQFIDPTTAKPFTNLVDWLEATWPNGAGMGQGQHAITYADALQLTVGSSDVHRVLAQHGRGESMQAELARFRKALAIQQRRHWHAVYDHRSRAWKLSEFLGTGEFLRFIRAGRFPDPVTAILEADRWYLEHNGPDDNPEPRWS